MYDAMEEQEEILRLGLNGQIGQPSSQSSINKHLSEPSSDYIID
jgi:hypothetical protein